MQGQPLASVISCKHPVVRDGLESRAPLAEAEVLYTDAVFLAYQYTLSSRHFHFPAYDYTTISTMLMYPDRPCAVLGSTPAQVVLCVAVVGFSSATVVMYVYYGMMMQESSADLCNQYRYSSRGSVSR